jgi:DNA-binding CsgD family transcriptional regulator
MTSAKPVRNRSRNVPAPTRSEAESGAQQRSDQALRKTGIRVMEDVPWGAHICMFYETTTDLLDAAASYFEAGLESNEFCLWVVSDPITEEDAKSSVRRSIPDFDRHLSDGRFELIQGSEWYLKGGEFQLQRIVTRWRAKLSTALARGYEGMRVSGNAFWSPENNHWNEFCEYEHALDRSLADQKMVVLCTYSLLTSRAVDILDVARAHQCSIARRNGNWEFLETPELKRAKQEIRRLSGALDTLSKSFPGHETLTPRERVALAQIVRGLSSKEIARDLDISPRTVEFHRTNLLKKLGAKNTVDLVRKVLGD